MARTYPGDLRKLISRMHRRGRLIRVRTEVDPIHELAAVAAGLEGRAAPVLFETVKGHDAPVIVGLYSSKARLAGLLGTDAEDLSGFIAGKVAQW